MKPVFSVVVPVYNVEKYIKRCVESIINQSFEEIEVILVNDGSTDNCPQICDYYSKIDNRIKVIHKKNGGLSDARNYGINASTGDYIIFLDSDDYLELDALRSFLRYTKQEADIILGNVKEIRNNSVKIITHSNNGKMKRNLTGIDVLKYELENGTMHMAACMNLYRREFLLNNNLFFKYGILHEDEQWTPRVFLAARKAIVTDIIFYNYIIRENSITRKKDKTQNAIDLINSIKELALIYDKLEDDYLKKLLNDYLVMLYLNAVYIGKLYRHNYKEFIDKKFLKERANSTKNVIKVRLFCFNIKLYYILNKFIKTLQLRE